MYGHVLTAFLDPRADRAYAQHGGLLPGMPAQARNEASSLHAPALEGRQEEEGRGGEGGRDTDDGQEDGRVATFTPTVPLSL